MGGAVALHVQLRHHRVVANGTELAIGVMNCPRGMRMSSGAPPTLREPSDSWVLP